MRKPTRKHIIIFLSIAIIFSLFLTVKRVRALYGNIQGWHDGMSGSVSAPQCLVYGWACDTGVISRKVSARIMVDGGGTPLATLTADQTGEAAIASQCGGDGNRRFSYTIPDNSSLRDGAAHNYTVQALDVESNTWVNLNGTPKSMTCPISYYTIGGYVRNRYNSLPVVGATVQIYDANLNASQFPVTDNTGHFTYPGWARIGDYYAVRPTGIPAGYLSPFRTTQVGWTWNVCNQPPNYPGDTVLNSPSYECQQANSNDCSSDQSATGGPAAEHCNFNLDPGGMVQGYFLYGANGTPNPGATITVNKPCLLPGPGGNCTPSSSGTVYSTGINYAIGENWSSSCTVSAPYVCEYSLCNSCTNHPAASYTVSSGLSGTIPPPPASYPQGYVDLYWQVITMTPTPALPTSTPTPTQGPWYKLKNTSFNKLSSDSYPNSLNDPIPASPSIYDSSDTTQSFLIGNDTSSPINDPGIVTYTGTGGAPYNLGNAVSPFFSSKGWSANYQTVFPPAMTPSQFITYVKARKEYSQIAVFPPLTNGIFILPSSLKTNAAGAGSGSYVLIINGDLTMDTNGAFNSVKKNVAFVVTGKLSINSSVTELNGIFIAKEVDFAYDILSPATTTNTLKINGNLIVQTQAESTRLDNLTVRQNPVASSPSIFINFNPDMYITLLPYLSTSTYDWTQQQ